MAENIELARAFVTIVPSMQGAQQTISEELGAAAGPAGEEAGEAIGSSMLSSLEEALGGIGKTLSATVTAPIVAAAAASVAAWRSVDTGLDIVASKTGATGEELENLQDLALDLAETMPVTFTDAGSAVGELATRFDLSGEELEALSRQFLRFSRVNGVEVSTTIDNVQKAMAALGVDVSETSDFLDTLNAVGQSTGIDMNTLASELLANAAVLNDMGMSAADAAFFVGSLDKAGIESSTALTALKRAMTNAAAEGLTTSEAIAQLQENLANAETTAEGVNYVAELFGTRAAPAMYNALQNGTITFDELGLAMSDFSGSVESTYDNTVGNLDNLTTVLNNLKELGYELVEAWAPTIQQVADTVIPVIQRLTDAWTALDPEVQQAIINIALIAAAVGPIILIASKFIGAFQTIGGAVSSLGSHLANFGSSAASAASGAATATTSFASMAGTAMMLVALGAALLMIAEGMSLMASAAISLAEAGPAAIATFFGLVAAGTAMAVVILLVGSASTVGAVGLLALGAAVLMVSAGVALIVTAMTAFVGQLPMIAEFAAPAASGLLRLNVAMVATVAAALAMSAALLALSAVALAAFVPFVAAAASIGLTDVALAAFLVTAGLATAGTLLLQAGLVGVAAQMSDIERSSASAADSLAELVDSVNVVESGMRGLESVARNVVNSFVRAITGQQSSARNAGQQLGSAVVNGVQAGIRPLSGDVRNDLSSALSAANGMQGQFQSAGQALGQAFVAPVIQSVAQLQATFAGTSFRFNSYIPLPHFSMYGSFDAKSGRVPTVGVQWYRDAAEQGARFTQPTIIGVGDARQPEILIGEDKLKELTGNGTTINITINGEKGQDVNELADAVALRLQEELDMKRAVFA